MLTKGTQPVPNPQPKVDLHIHSDRSDGNLSYKQIIDYSLKVGLKAISITDHDSISGLEAAEKYSRQQGLEFINGIEISARIKNFDLHLLGYFFDFQNRQLIEYVNYFQNERVKRAKKIIKQLKNFGIRLPFETVQQIAGHGSIGRPHIADAMVKEGIIDNYYEAFGKYIGDGCPCAVPKYKISQGEAISLINSAGGICVLAHPGSDVSDEFVFNLIKVGLEGIETICPRHTQDQIDHFREIVYKYELLETGGSDCHGKKKYSIIIGKLNVPYDFVEKMKERLSYKKYS